MAAHQSIVTSLRVTIRGRPNSGWLVDGGVLPEGTIGIIRRSGTNPWTREVEYDFFPNNFTETTDSELGSSEKIVVLKNDVLCRLTDNVPTTVSIAVGGFTRIRHVRIAPTGVGILDRCKIIFEGSEFKIVPVNLSDGNNWYVGRLLHKTASESPLLYADYAKTQDVDFFRQRPLPGPAVEPAVEPVSSSLSEEGDLGGSTVYLRPSRYSSDEEGL